MGESYSKEDEAREEAIFMSRLFHGAQTSGLMPDIGIDDSLVKFSGLNSTAVLQDYSSQLSVDLSGKAPDYIADLGTALASLKAVPNAVGLGALVISLILDLAVSSTASKNSDSTLNMLRRVFAEEKASGVRDTMDEYMKRLGMFMRDPLKALEETERLEKQLSYQLTSLKNSMHDGQMSSRAMKYWINGAAFHSQMLVHAARLKTASSPIRKLDDINTAVNTAVNTYRGNLHELLKKYKSFKHETIRLRTSYICSECIHLPCVVWDNENNLRSPSMYGNLRFKDFCESSQDAYINYMFNNWHMIKPLDEYFLDLKTNLKELILQRQTFSG